MVLGIILSVIGGLTRSPLSMQVKAFRCSIWGPSGGLKVGWLARVANDLLSLFSRLRGEEAARGSEDEYLFLTS